MKRLIAALAISFAPTLAISAEDAGKIEADRYYKVRVWTGFSPHDIEFTPKGNPDYTCIFLNQTGNMSGMNCFPQKK